MLIEPQMSYCYNFLSYFLILKIVEMYLDSEYKHMDGLSYYSCFWIFGTKGVSFLVCFFSFDNLENYFVIRIPTFQKSHFNPFWGPFPDPKLSGERSWLLISKMV